MSTDVRLIPDIHDKTTEDMLVALVSDGWRIVVTSGGTVGWVASATKPNDGTFISDESATLYEAALKVYEAIFPPGDTA